MNLLLKRLATFIPALALLFTAACSKRPATPSYSFDPSLFHLDKTKIEQLPAGELRGQAMGVILNVFKDKGVEDYEAAAKALPKPWRAIYTSLQLLSEVENGGFHQYFFNTRAKLLGETQEDLQLLGANEFAAIFQKALAGIDLKYYTSPDRNEDDWEKFTTKYADHQWDDLEKQLYASEKKKHMDDFIAEYMKAHPEQFQ